MTDDTTDGGATDGGVDGPDSRSDAPSPERIEQLASDFRDRGQPFARVTVVRREPPVSANVGDQALVTPDGDLTGWIGGAACAQSVVVDEATAALERDEPVLVGLAPDPADVDRAGVEAYPMTCHSGGTLELFIEPVTPVPRLVVVGDSPIARALVRLADETSFDVLVVTGPDTEPGPGDHPGADSVLAADDDLAAAMADATAVVVASMGEYDETGLDAALRADATYVGLVASDTRRDEVVASVADSLGSEVETVAEAVTTPAGLDIGAETPEEIAVSILAELVAVRRDATDAVSVDTADVTAVDASPAADGGTGGDDTGDGGDRADDSAGDGAADAETVVDPVCGMDVTTDEATTVRLGEETYHFCGEGCAEAFEDDPDRYLEETANG